jgi:hypothetical protein
MENPDGLKGSNLSEASTIPERLLHEVKHLDPQAMRNKRVAGSPHHT